MGEFMNGIQVLIISKIFEYGVSLREDVEFTLSQEQSYRNHRQFGRDVS